MAAQLFVDNDNLIKITNVRDVLTGEPVTDMTGTVTIYDQNDAALTGASALSINYATPTDGSPEFYYALVPDTVQFADGTWYLVVFDSTNYGVHLEKKFQGATRTG